MNLEGHRTITSGFDNRRNGKEEILINPKAVRDLQLKWKFFAGKDISVTPAVANGVLYFLHGMDIYML